MSRDMSLLIEEFHGAVDLVLHRCKKQSSIIMTPFFTLRTPEEQAKIWRSTRATSAIEATIQHLRKKGADYLADVLESVGPQPGTVGGPHKTNALPGMSWHQYGEAVDCYWNVNGKAIWSSKLNVGEINGYRIYLQEAEAAGLKAGGRWGDWPHIQYRQEEVPEVYTLDKVNSMMKERFDES